MISFTGSGPVGKKVLAAAANSNLEHVTLELGGKSPAIVFDDCDFNKTVRQTLEAIVMNSGQGYVVASRMYVQEGIYDKFVVAYKAAMEARATGFIDPLDPQITQGAPGRLSAVQSSQGICGTSERTRPGTAVDRWIRFGKEREFYICCAQIC